jgi:hypothetical protein
LRGDHDLALEALGGHAGRQLGGKHLHDDLALETRFAGKEDARHASAELALERVGRA